MKKGSHHDGGTKCQRDEQHQRRCNQQTQAPDGGDELHSNRKAAFNEGVLLADRQIMLRVSVITSGAQPVLKLRWVGEEVQREDIAQEFKTVLQEKIGDAAALSLGAFDPK